MILILFQCVRCAGFKNPVECEYEEGDDACERCVKAKHACYRDEHTKLNGTPRVVRARRGGTETESRGAGAKPGTYQSLIAVDSSLMLFFTKAPVEKKMPYVGKAQNAESGPSKRIVSTRVTTGRANDRRSLEIEVREVQEELTRHEARRSMEDAFIRILKTEETRLLRCLKVLP